MLEHPGIVRLLDGGATPEGVPYLVTEFIDGPRLDESTRPISGTVSTIGSS